MDAAKVTPLRQETKAKVESQTDKALELYADIEKVVEANHLEADKEFTDMKKQLTDMATEVKGKLAQAKEEDAKLALQEIDGIIDNLTKVKNYVDKTVSDAEIKKINHRKLLWLIFFYNII